MGGGEHKNTGERVVRKSRLGPTSSSTNAPETPDTLLPQPPHVAVDFSLSNYLFLSSRKTPIRPLTVYKVWYYKEISQSSLRCRHSQWPVDAVLRGPTPRDLPCFATVVRLAGY